MNTVTVPVYGHASYGQTVIVDLGAILSVAIITGAIALIVTAFCAAVIATYADRNNAELQAIRVHAYDLNHNLGTISRILTERVQTHDLRELSQLEQEATVLQTKMTEILKNIASRKRKKKDEEE